MTRVLVADDQALVRAGLVSVLGSDPRIAVVGEAADGEEAVAAARRLVPDVVLMDIRMPGLDGLTATRRIVAEHPGIRVLVVTTFDVDEYVFEALRIGASGFMLKDEAPEAILSAVHAVASGHTLVAPVATARLVAQWSGRRPVVGLEALTPRETEVLRLVARGLTNAEIAAELYVEESTVKTHIGRLLGKLGARDRVQLVISAYESGLG
ncbi:MAG TPA: response regulator transcription factor [Mycobacteriales bacterium]|nr:response regulator transcription factor [Mycobacteriales bacterium]